MWSLGYIWLCLYLLGLHAAIGSPIQASSLQLPDLSNSTVTDLGANPAIDPSFEILANYGEDRVNGLQAFIAAILAARDLARHGFNRNHPDSTFHYHEAPQIWIRIKGKLFQDFWTFILPQKDSNK